MKRSECIQSQIKFFFKCVSFMKVFEKVFLHLLLDIHLILPNFEEFFFVSLNVYIFMRASLRRIEIINSF